MERPSIILRTRSNASMNFCLNVGKKLLEQDIDVIWDKLDLFHEKRDHDILVVLTPFKDKVPPLVYNYWKNKLENKLNLVIEQLCCYLSHEQFNLIKDE